MFISPIAFVQFCRMLNIATVYTTECYLHSSQNNLLPLSVLFASCSSKTTDIYVKEARSMEQKDKEKREFKILDQELKNLK